MLRRHSSLQFQRTQFVRSQRRAIPRERFTACQHIPYDYCEFASSRDGGNLLAAAIAHAQEEGAQRPGRLRCTPSGFDQHRPSIRAPALGDVTMPGRCRTGLID
ncbi:hypothetical protein WK24_30270 [Burkholderia vietnamiensis]|uniref:Uncharacterized protein n=1 Tax=Burkholderia ubonensis TaxID=101571 RepID=A0A1B4LH26_9BURK|nr:hypothetical protein WJ35_09435 [Burkholderia ubonensis]AOK00642.1 hypothetical protein WK23_19535 [Burkholderia vietnamiensis]AOJ76471.1 hypothetical protein WJ35_15215 [Burkholderia ubonensis]AOJ78853.1 hypothetical protein WJ35_28465 [Burkholderia ubonensis]AOK09097.1 hypothetical protein WK31_01995 [Burkholderia vietnamiensis]